MRVFYTDRFVLPLPATHRFPMSKYRLLRERLVADGTVRESELEVPPAVTEAQLHLVHDRGYVARALRGQLAASEIRRIGFPWSPQLVERSRRSAGATVAAARAALERGVGINLAGGTHHAGPDFGEGYCVFNDAACAVRALQQESRIARALIVDCDVHQGNGTALIFRDDPSVFTFSIHGARNFPLRKVASRLDVALADGTGDDDYLAALAPALVQAFSQADAELVVYLAGADPFVGDRLGRLRLTKTGLAARDRLVFESCRAARLPVAVAMAGGYAENVADIVDIHAATVRAARQWCLRPATLS